jgi:clan AA aspartic protease
MIRGQVNPRKEAIITVQVRDPRGQSRDVQATIDTGFSGYLTLSPALIAALQLPYDRTEVYTLGDSRSVAIDLYSATVAWDGQDRAVFVLATGRGALVGMSLLHGYHLFVDVVDGGDVRIEARP